MEDLISKTKAMVMNECKSDNNNLDESIFNFHLKIVERYCLDLSKTFTTANKIVLQLAAYVHDLAAIRNYDLLPVHNQESAKLAKEIFCNSLDNNALGLLEDAIANHNLPYNNGAVESLILSNADAMSKFDYPIYWISYVYKRRFSSFKESVNWYKNLISNVYGMLVPEAKSMSEAKYQQALIISEAYLVG